MARGDAASRRATGSRDRASRLPPACGTAPAQAGIGLRFAHHREVQQRRPRIAWLEVHSENYMSGGAALECLEALRRDYPVSLHGVGMSLGSADALDGAHLARLARLVERVEPALVSEHLAWSVVDHTYLADLLPLPLTEEALAVMCRHVDELQSALGRRILIENPSTYLRFAHSTIPEWEFLAVLAARTGCGLLCDINNIWVSACNHGFDAARYLNALPAQAIGEFHLAGHATRVLAGGRMLRIDDHGSRVSADVWALYAFALERVGPRPTLIEWDTQLPALDVLLGEAATAQAAIARASRGTETAHALAC
ncbi:MAG: DUF692 domain-containing protein [Burkholderiales bacterium]|nr:DUF692 domain-containing protein [Burkholderiales bacterium]